MGRFAAAGCVILAVGGALSARAAGDFVPGALYTIASGHDCPFPGSTSWADRIYEFNPASGQWKMFAELPKGPAGHCGLSGMTFTPQGKLRVSAYYSGSILEFEGDGSWKVVLDGSNGIAGPLGPNNLAYDPSGDFFVYDFGGPGNNKIMKFPGGNPPGSIFAGGGQLVSGGSAPIAAAPDGSIYYNPSSYGPTSEDGAILRYTPDGNVSLFDLFPGDVSSLAVAADGDLYVTQGLVQGGTWRFESGDPTKKTMVSVFGGWPSAIALSPDATTLYAVLSGGAQKVGLLWAVDLTTGDYTHISTSPMYIGAPNWGFGLAVYVPEPATITSLVGFAILVLRRR